jgi:hypothetical protein
VRRFLWTATAIVLPVVLDCGALVGVEEVGPRKPAPRDAGGPTPPGDDDDDDSMSSGTPGPKEPGPKGCEGALDCSRVVFVTKAAWSGDLGGLKGADDKCTAAAKGVPALADRTFRAWVSDDASTASSRHPHGKGSYVRVDKAVVANDFSDLTDGTLAAEISLDEEGNPLPSTDLERSVWTGTIADGVADPFTCGGWKSASAVETGLFGDSLAKDLSWTEKNPSSCDRNRHLYCLEF